MIVQNPPPPTVRHAAARAGPRSAHKGRAPGAVESPRAGRKPDRKPKGCGAREVGIAFLWAAAITTPVLGIGARRIYSDWAAREQAHAAVVEAGLAHERLVAAPAGGTLPVDVATLGRDLFQTSCVACHGPTGTGVAGLGLDLTESDFVAAQSDGQLLAFLATGRPEAKPPMPARGGNPDLSDSDLNALAVYLRGLQDPRRMPELPEMVVVVAETTEEEAAADLAAAGGDAELAEFIASGRKLFATSCASCHGKDARGLPSLGVDLVDSAFRRGLDEEALLAFIQRGRDPSDPGSKTGIAMPPKGGNPALSEDDIFDIIDYLTSLDPSAGGAASGTQ
jgi:mono/diheme cytochrome c family protein